MTAKCSALRWWGLGVWLLVTLGVVQPAAAIPTEKLGRFAVGKLPQSPTIDGRIDAKEWQHATAISGVAGQNPSGNRLMMRPTTFYLGWDEQNLYLAARVWVMPGYKPRVPGRKPGSAGAWDDGLEIGLHPMGENVVQGRTDSSYKFMMTALGSLGERARISVGQLFKSWAPDFERAHRLTAPGSAPKGGRWWEAEIVLPARDFELSGPNRAGDLWKALLGFNHMPIWNQSAIPLTTGYFDSSGWPELVLVEQTPVTQVTMDRLPGPLDGRFAARLSVFNPRKNPASVQVETALIDTGAENVRKIDPADFEGVWRQRKLLEIAANSEAVINVDRPIPEKLSDRISAIEINVTQADRTLYRYFVYVEQEYSDRWVRGKPREEPFTLKARYNPVRSNLMFAADSYPLNDPGRVESCDYRVVRVDGEGAVAAGTLTEPSYFYYEKLLQLPPLKPGEYEVRAELNLSDGSTLGPVTTRFRKFDESKEFAEWWNNDLGPTDRVIWPFEAIEHSGDALSVWGRTYRLDSLGLPRQIESQGGAVMAAPARLVVVRDGEAHRVPVDAALRVINAQDHRVAFEGTAEAAGVVFEVSGALAQDGLVKLDLSYAPAQGEAVDIEALRLEFPLDTEAAEMLLCTGIGGNFAPIVAREMDSEARGRVWSTLEMGRQGSGMTVGNFYPDVWLGNERRGFLWWADSDEGWFPNNEVAAHEVVRTDEAVVLRNNFVGQPVTLRERRTITMSYNASPFRPRPTGWRATINSEDGTFLGKHKKWTDPETGKLYDGHHWLSPPGPPEQWEQLWAEFQKHAEQKVQNLRPTQPLRARRKDYVHTSMALMGNYGSNLTGDKRVSNYFEPEWHRENALTPTQRDYITYLAHQAFSKGGLKSIYWDIFFVKKFETLENGMGYRLPDGRVQPTFNGFHLRDLSMRIQSVAMDLGLQPGVLMNHNTNNYVLVAFPWLDATLDGEWAFIKEDTERDWVDFYPSERMRIITPQNFGPVVTWMERIYDRERRPYLYRGFLDWARMHDASWYYWNSTDMGPPEATLDYGLADHGVTYRPYWREHAVSTDAQDVMVSLWKTSDRAIILPFNYDKTKTKSPTLRVDWSALGMPEPGSESHRIVVRELRGIERRDLWLPEKDKNLDPEPIYDESAGVIRVPGLAPRSARYIGVRAESVAARQRVRPQVQTVLEAAGVEDTGEQAKTMLDQLGDFGLLDNKGRFMGQGEIDWASAPKGVRLFAWRNDDSVALALINTDARKRLKNLSVPLDFAAAGLALETRWQDFLRSRLIWPASDHNFEAVRRAGHRAPKIQYHDNRIVVPDLAGGETIVVGVRRFATPKDKPASALKAVPSNE